MTTIQPIETKYKGYRLRSRLEARWAVFFDALGVNWEYEAQGFDLGAAGWYLPDFYFPDIGWFGEVKPNRYYSDADALKMKTFDRNPPDGYMGLIYLIGIPEMHIGCPSGDPGRDSVFHFCGRAGLFERALIQEAVDAARSARFDRSDDKANTNICRWQGFTLTNGELLIYCDCGYEFPDDALWADAESNVIYCPGCGKRITSGIVDAPF